MQQKHPTPHHIFTATPGLPPCPGWPPSPSAAVPSPHSSTPRCCPLSPDSPRPRGCPSPRAAPAHPAPAPPPRADDAPATAAPGFWLRFQDGGRAQPSAHAQCPQRLPGYVVATPALRMRIGAPRHARTRGGHWRLRQRRRQRSIAT